MRISWVGGSNLISIVSSNQFSVESSETGFHEYVTKICVWIFISMFSIKKYNSAKSILESAKFDYIQGTCSYLGETEVDPCELHENSPGVKFMVIMRSTYQES